MKNKNIVSDLPSIETAGETSPTSNGQAALGNPGQTAPGMPSALSPIGDNQPPVHPPSATQAVTVQTVVDLLKPAVFLSWPLGTKGGNRAWGHLTQADMTPEYLAKLADRGGNIGVVFGRKSMDGDGAVLAGIDLDRADVVAAFLEANPKLRGTWLSRGRPDRLLVILRVKGPYPKYVALVHATETVVGDDGKVQAAPLGEWRTDGHQSIIPPSFHPDTQKPYEAVSLVAPVVVEYSEIVWPAIVGNPPSLKGTSDTVVVSPGLLTKPSTHDTLLSFTESSNGVFKECPSKVSSKSVTENCTTVSIEAFVQPFVVGARGHSNQAILNMGRRLKGLQQSGIVLDLKAVFMAWWDKSKANVDSKWTADWFYAKLRNAVETSTGGSITDIFERAKTITAPGAESLLDDRLKLLAATCYLLQQANGGKEFYLSCGKVVELFSPMLPGLNRMDAWRWLRDLEQMNLIETVGKGGKLAGAPSDQAGVATRYRYIG